MRERSATRWAEAALAAVGACALVCAPARALDRGADGEFDRRESSHFVLFQDVDIDRSGGFHGSRRFEQELLATLESAYDKLDGLLDLRPERKIEVVVYDPGVFDAQFASLFRFPAGGFYHGVIRVRGATAVDLRLTRVLHHELVHAALDAAAPSFAYPGWLNEGLAEWFEARALGKRGLSSGELAVLAAASRGGALVSLAELQAPAFGFLDAERARLAYLQSYGLVDFLVRRKGERSLRDVLRVLIRTRNLDRALHATFGAGIVELDGSFVAELG